jgi:hypothetical protein
LSFSLHCGCRAGCPNVECRQEAEKALDERAAKAWREVCFNIIEKLYSRIKNLK